MCSKKAKLDVVSIAWDHYRNFIDSQQDDDNDDEGDVDELVELLEILEPHVDQNWTDMDLTTTRRCWPSILCSVAHCHLASFAIADPAGSNHDVTHHLQASLDHFAQNAAAWSIGANFARCRASPAQVCAWYLRAAECASTLRSTALVALLDDQLRDDNVKEWIELLLLNDIVGAEYVCEHNEEGPHVESTDVEEEHENNVELGGYVSASNVEATSRFMAAMLLSTMGRHDQALQQLRRFHLTHRLHPNVWSNNNAAATTCSDGIPATKKSPLLPCAFAQAALPAPLYDRLCKVLRPDASYWNESDYAHRGYHSYFFDIDEPTNLMEDVIVNHLLPRALQVLKDDGDDTAEIVGVEWWPHTRPIQANLGHQLHFDTDEALLVQEGKITHPILSSVLYLTGGDSSKESTNPAGATIVLDQTPDSLQVAQVAWRSIPRNNTYMVFPGNLLHGVLPCPGSADVAATLETEKDAPWSFQSDDSVTPGDDGANHRLTFMVGFWTRRVPDGMKDRRLYGPCGPLPPANDEHTWVKEIRDGYPKQATRADNKGSLAKFETVPLPKVSPAWESIATEDEEEDDDEQVDPPLELPRAIDHCFFVQGAPQCFRDSLFPTITNENQQ